MIDHLKKAKAIRNVVRRATEQGWRKESAYKDAIAWLDRPEQKPTNYRAIRDFIDVEYLSAGRDYAGRKLDH